MNRGPDFGPDVYASRERGSRSPLRRPYATRCARNGPNEIDAAERTWTSSADLLTQDCAHELMVSAMQRAADERRASGARVCLLDDACPDINLQHDTPDRAGVCAVPVADQDFIAHARQDVPRLVDDCAARAHCLRVAKRDRYAVNSRHASSGTRVLLTIAALVLALPASAHGLTLEPIGGFSACVRTSPRGRATRRGCSSPIVAGRCGPSRTAWERRSSDPIRLAV